VNVSVAYLDILAILERIVALLVIILDIDILRMHEEIVGVTEVDMAQTDVAAVPECLLGVRDSDMCKLDAVHLAEHLGCLDERVGHFEIRRVPKRGPCSGDEHAVGDIKALDMPERIFPLKTTMGGGYVRTAFKG